MVGGDCGFNVVSSVSNSYICQRTAAAVGLEERSVTRESRQVIIDRITPLGGRRRNLGLPDLEEFDLRRFFGSL